MEALALIVMERDLGDNMVVSFSREELREEFKEINLSQVNFTKLDPAYFQSFFKASLVLFVDGDNCVILKRRHNLTKS